MHANLGGADLTDANLANGANLFSANLTDARLDGAYLVGVNLTRAALSDARLSGANLANADLTGARLDGADLTGARWPEGAQVPDGWMVDSSSGRLERAGELSAWSPRGVVAFARESDHCCHTVPWRNDSLGQK
jgi:hypothetical protein